MDKEKIKQFITTQREAGIPDAEIHSFLVEKGAISMTGQPVLPEKKRTVLEKVADFTGGKELGQGIAQAINLPKASKQLDDMLDTAMAQQNDLLAKRKELKASGGDTSAIDKALKLNLDQLQKISAGAEAMLNPNDLTNKQVIGDALQLFTTIAGAGTYGKGFVAGGKEATLKNIITNTGKTKELPNVVGAVKEVQTFGKGAVEGLKTGAITGGAIGAGTGASQALQEDKTLGGIVRDTLVGGALGGVTGGILGSVTGGVSGAIKGRKLRNEILNKQIELGEKEITKTYTPVQQKAIKLAEQQGFDKQDIDFMMSMKPQDKIKAQKMVELAEKTLKDKRSLERPIDVVGDSMLDRVKFIQAQNSKAGKGVDLTAKALKGQKIDTTPVREKALSLLEDAGVYANPNGTPNWSKSIFNKTPELKNKIMKTLSDLPAGEMDAYDLHNFKKSIDEVVNYGVKGEGLKGKSANILKAVRNSADEILDANFADYNKANTDYKATRDVLDIANDLFGKKAGLSKERGGQLLRSVYSNNASRQRVMSLVEQLDKVAKQYGGKFDDNLLDQTLFTELLEDVYGTQATTSLQGQVARAVKGTQKVIEGVRNPIKGAGELLATVAEKTAGITPENKKKILNAFLR
jgi:hypothetical protein